MLDFLLDTYNKLYSFISNLNKTESILLVGASIHILLIVGYILFIGFTGLCLVITPICTISSLPITIIAIIIHILIAFMFIIFLIISFFIKNTSSSSKNINNTNDTDDTDIDIPLDAL